jgi:hypothetical protein
MVAVAAVFGVSACGSSGSGGLFQPNEAVDAGLDAAPSLPDSSATEATSTDTSSESLTDATGSTGDVDSTSDSADSVSGTPSAATDTTSTLGETTETPSTDTADSSGTDVWPASTQDSVGSSATVASSTDDATTTDGSDVTDATSIETSSDDITDTQSGVSSGSSTSATTEVVTTSDEPTSEASSVTGETTEVTSETSRATNEGTSAAQGSTVDGETNSASDVSTSDSADADTSMGGSSGAETSSSAPTDPVPPTCVVSMPSKTLLNGVAAPTGDRANSPSAPFKTSITVTTDVPNGSNVVLSTGSGPSLLTQASAGSAVFSAVELAPDGDYVLRATCHGALTTVSDPLVITVDTAGPVVGSGVVPIAGQHYSPGDDENTGTPGVLDFSVCVPVTSDDALDLSSDNVCVFTGAAGPFCAEAVSDGVAPGTDGVCVPVVCPGSAPFNVDVRVSDEAGNPTTITINGVTCASQTPTVQIVSLTDNRTAPTNIGLRLLAAGNTNPGSILKDSDSHTTGAQHAVVACTNATIGSSASLRVGLEQGSITQRATGTVQADTNGVCPTGLTGVVSFPVTTLDNSSVTAGVLQAYTVVRVLVTDVSTEVGTSPDVHLWVDPTLPVLQVLFPTRLCEDGILPSNGDDVTASVNMRSGGVYPVSARLVRKSDNFSIGTYTFANSNDFVDVTFPLGTYSYQATALEASGNLGILGSCDVKVADLPEITWNSPLATTQALVGAAVVQPNSIQDEDELVVGWQGPLQITVTPPQSESLDGMSVQFKVNGVDVGSAITLVDANGANVSVSLDVDILDGDVDITAEILGAADEVVSTLTDIVVDTAPPEAATGLQAAVQNRRESSFTLSWTPPLGGVEGYHVAYVPVDAGDTTTVINDANFDDATQAADADGEVNSTVVHDLMIEQRYLFALRPYDSSGNLGPVVATTSPVRAVFQTLVVDPPLGAIPGTQWGFSVDASTDLNGDGAADMVVGQKYGDRVSIYLGLPSGTYAAQPDVVIDGPPDSGFGYSVAVVGNVAGDGFEDLVIAAPTDSTDGTFGRVYVVTGRAWSNQYVDLTDGTNPTGSIITFPTSLALADQVVRLGDFDSDGDFDFGIHANAYDSSGACDPGTGANCDGAFILIKGLADPTSFPTVIDVPADVSAFESYFPSSIEFYGADWLMGITDFVSSRSGVLAAEYQAGAQRILTRNASAQGGFDAQVLDYGPPIFSGNTLTYDTEIGSYPAALTGSDTLAIQLTGARDGLRVLPGIVDLYTLSSTDTFSAPYKTFQAGGGSNNFGQILIGNRYSGRPSSYSLPFFGTNPEAPSLIMGGGTYQGKLPKLFMLGSDTLSALAATPTQQELTGTADVEYLLSDVAGLNPDWVDALGQPSADADWHGGVGFAVRDMNSDGFADIGVAEWAQGGLDPSNYTGGIIILY